MSEREQLEETLAEERQSFANAEKALKSAVKAFEGAIGNVPTETLVELAAAVSSATATVGSAKTAESKATGAYARIAAAEARIEEHDFDLRSGVLREAIGSMQQAIEAAVVAHIDALAEFEVTALNVGSITFDGDGQPLVSLEAVGDKIPRKQRAVRKSSNGSGGTRSRKTYVLNGARFSSREFVEQHGAELLTGKVSVQDVLDNPTKHGLSHVADRLAGKMGASVESA
jgi:hypothetical protein